MNKLPEPDDVEFFIGDVVPDADACIETAKFIEEYKRRPEYRSEAEAAERILTALGIEARDYGMQDPGSLLDHWRKCVADLHESAPAETDGRDVDPTAGARGDPRPGA